MDYWNLRYATQKKSSDDKKSKADPELAINEAKRTNNNYRASKMYGISYVILYSDIKRIRGAKKKEKKPPVTISPIEDHTRLMNYSKIVENMRLFILSKRSL